MASQSSLASEIQHVLQDAVGQVNNPPDNHPDPAKKKRKRHDPRAADNQDDTSRKKRKKKKKCSSEQPQAVSITRTSESVIDPILSVTTIASGARFDGTGKKQKRKDKGKQRAGAADVPPVQDESSMTQEDTQMQPHHSASTAAFLSALVAAASATTDPLSVHDHPETQLQQSFDNAFPSPYTGQLSQYLPSGVQPFQYPSPLNFADQANAFFSSGPSIPELASHANEEILRSLQDVDITKLQSVLKTLGEAAASAQLPTDAFPVPQGFVGMPQRLLPTPPVKQNPATSYAILGQPPKNAQAPKAPVWEQHGNPAHAELLATKWMNAKTLAEMVKNEGLVYHKGKFSEIEQSQLKNALEVYRNRNGLSPEQLNEIIFSKDKVKDKELWSELTCAVPLRPINAVYHYIRRAYHPLKGQGKWTTAQDTLLKQAVNDCGQQWEKVSERVGRMASDCRDRYRNHLADRHQRKTGTWSKEEEDELTAIVTEMTLDKGKDMDNDIFWGVVSRRMGNKRGRQQCRIKWVDSLSKTLKNEGEKPRWAAQDAYILVHKIDSLNARHDSEIDWKALPDADWNLWSPHLLQRRWTTMKRSIRGYETMSQQEIMDILRVKKATNLPTFSVASPSRKKVKSSAMVREEDASDRDGDRPQAGPSTGAGTKGTQSGKDTNQSEDDESTQSNSSDEE